MGNWEYWSGETQELATNSRYGIQLLRTFSNRFNHVTGTDDHLGLKSPEQWLTDLQEDRPNLI